MPSKFAIHEHHEFLAASREALDSPNLQIALNRLGETLALGNRNAFEQLPGSSLLRDKARAIKDETLAHLDIVLVSVHSRFNLSKPAMTRRIVRALQHPRVHVLGHPTGRLIGKREPYPLDMEEIVKAARDYGVLLEVNAQPDRLDLNDLHVAMARQAGVRVVIGTDAHRVEELACMRYGVDQARRGWCEAKDVANTLNLEMFRKLIQK